MPVKLNPTDLFQDCQELQKFLWDCQQISRKKEQAQLVSLSIKIDPIDPLVFFQHVARSNQFHFYLENHSQQRSIAAIDAVIYAQPQGVQRFEQAQAFIRSCLENTIVVGDLSLPDAGPRFWCSFTFFDRPRNSPFPAATVFLPRWQVTRCGDRSAMVANLAITPQTEVQLVARQVWQYAQRWPAQQRTTSPSWDRSTAPQPTWDLRNIGRFKRRVLGALEAIERERLQKIVLSHAIDITAEKPFNLYHSLDRLRQLYPDCYTFSTSTGSQQFIGASPERLLEIRDRQLTTDALAGSAPRGITPAEDAALANRLLCSEKERHEHQVVLDFIIQHLAQLGVNLKAIPPMRLLQLSNIQHLWTPIRATVPDRIESLHIVAALHPTPAVAGAPRSIALQEIPRYETCDRSLYAAPLGWIDYRGDSEFIVGIRSALIEGCRARLYAGAGIVAGSDAQKELAEIQLKYQAILKALI
jgi:menaquinone-specific isochorismate synthase